MKKLFLSTLFLAIISSSNSFAATIGSYLSADAIYSTLSFREYYDQNGLTAKDRHSFRKEKIGYGATYKYAINFNRFFIAPGAFFERNKIVASGAEEVAKSRELEVKSRFGAKVEMGYDITDNFAAYLTGGYSGIFYRTRNYSYQGDSVYTTRDENDLKGSAFYGAGIKFDINELSSIGLEFTTQTLNARTRIPNDYLDHKSKYKSRLNVLKMSIAYRF